MYTLFKKLALIFLLNQIIALGLAACSGLAWASKKPVDVQVTLTEFKIDSSITTFKIGVPYHFTVMNQGLAPHEIEIMPPVSGEVTQDQVQKMALAGIGQNQLQPGVTATLDYTFTKLYPSGSLEFACHVPGHYEAGMHTPIVVKD